MTFEPRLVGFLCNWCTYAGADLAGTSRMQYPPNVDIVKATCSGPPDPALTTPPHAPAPAAALEPRRALSAHGRNPQSELV